MDLPTRTPRLWIALTVSLTGIALCIGSITRFFSRIIGNGLQWNEREFFQEHYLAVGEAYSRAFMVGFFLCFFLVVIAVTIGGQARRSSRRSSGTGA